MATFFADPVLTAACKAANTQSASPLPAHWEAIVPRANIRAFIKIRSIMLGRGFTASQFAAWGNGEETDGYDWNLRFGVVFAFIEASKGDEDRGAAYQQELKDLIEELKESDVVIDGENAVPDASQGRISSGDMDTSEDRFTLDDPADGRYSIGDGSRL